MSRAITTKRPSFKRATVLGIFIALSVLMAGIGMTYAWNMHEATQPNNLSSHSTEVKIVESFPDPTVGVGATKPKVVQFQNTGSAPAFLRVSYAETWTSNTGEWLESNGSHATKDWASAWSAEWVYIDGWYYYTKVLAAGASTTQVLNSVSFPMTLPSAYANGSYTLNFQAEVVQLSDEASVNTSAVQSVFGRSAVVSSVTTANGAVTSGTVTWS